MPTSTQTKTNTGITLTVLVVTIIIMLILAGVTISLLNGGGILKNSQSAADKYEISDEQDVISVAFSTVFANSALNDKDITPEMLQKELDKTTRETSVTKSTDTGKENLLYITFDKTKNKHSVDITNGRIDYIGQISPGTEDILDEAVITISADPTVLTNGDVTVEITYTLPEDRKIEKDKIVLEYALNSLTTWSKYTGELTIKENMTVLARLNYLGETSHEASKTITNIDKLPPLAFTPTITKTTNSITVTASTEDAPKTSQYACSGLAGYSFSKDDGTTWTAYQTSGTYTFGNLTQGTTFKILVKAKDKVGNESQGYGKDGGTKPIEITTEEITGKITFGNAVWTKTSNSATVTVNVDKLQSGCKLQYKIGESGTWTDITSGQSIPGQPSGTKVYARIWDGLNEGPGTGYASTTILDNTAPATPKITNPTNQNWTNQDFSLTLASSDSQSGIAYYQYSYDQTNWTTYANSNKDNFVTTPFTAERNQLVYIRCIDYVGNISGVSSTYIRIDKTKPVVTTATATTNKITFTATDGIGVVAYAVTESNTAPTTGWTTVTSTTSYSGSVTGKTQNKTYYVWAKDAAGNVSAGKSTKTAQVAELTISVSDADKWTKSKTVTITAKDSNYNTIRYTIDGTAPTATKGTTITSGGSFTINSNCQIYAIAYDNTNQLGKQAAYKVTKIDNTAPTNLRAWDRDNGDEGTNSIIPEGHRVHAEAKDDGSGVNRFEFSLSNGGAIVHTASVSPASTHPNYWLNRRKHGIL